MPVVSARKVASHEQTGNSAGLDPNAVCASCHQEIYERYKTTPMANASGLAADGFLPGGFMHAASGVSYRMMERDGKVYLTFAREQEMRGSVSDQTNGIQEDRGLNGRRELKYFLGSGRRGRTYLFEQEGYWFEIPVNWYGKKRIWDMAPNYQNAREMPLTLPVDPGCLRCHASDAQPSLPEARNRYAGEPFLEGGITCTACHGDPAAHLASRGRTAMLKLNELLPAQRDSVCLSCHLEGQEAVDHQGKRLVDFRPGESIFDYTSYFVRQGQPGSKARATSQWEALLQSGCKRGAGDKLTCTTCHDPHGSAGTMSAEQRVFYYRAKCLACHEAAGDAASTHPETAGKDAGNDFGATHHPENQDCTSCHMPRAKAEDIAHEQVTNHRIPRLAQAAKRPEQEESAAGTLVVVGSAVGVPGQSSSRDLGLAYALAATRGDRAAGERAMELLREAEALPGSETDPELHEQLGFLHQLAGEKEAAAREYDLALAADAYDAIAAGNLAFLKAGDREYGEAAGLWRRAFQEDPVQLKAGLNLAIVECGLGKSEAAVAALDRVLAFSPDDGQAREMRIEIRSGRRGCQTH